MKKKKKKQKQAVVGVALLAALIIGGVGTVNGIYQKNKNQVGFLKNTTLNGQDVTGRTAEDVAAEIAKAYSQATVQITENGQVVLEGDLADFGYSFNEEALKETLDQEMAEQKESLRSVYHSLTEGDEIVVDTAYEYDASRMDAYVKSANFSVPRVTSEDARLELNTEANQYQVIPAVQGNEVDDAILVQAVKETIDEAASQGAISGTVTLAVPENAYSSKVVSTDYSQLEAEAKQKNKELLLDEYKQVKITYQFGNETQELTSDTFMDWLSIDNENVVTVDESKVEAYVEELAMNYNTRHWERTFQTSTGMTITIPADNNDYGYIVDQEAETKLLIAELTGKTSAEREPVYIKTNDYGNPYYYRRNGSDDLAGCYVEINLTRQHLWFYMDGNLVVESDVVSGNLEKKQGTMVGVFPLAYQESPSTLRGANYETEVEYWMPFYEGEGLHDAPWRNNFGGDIYETNGSNGCINLPPEVAKTIFENIDAGVPIVLYYEPGTEPDEETYASDTRNMADNPADFTE